MPATSDNNEPQKAGRKAEQQMGMRNFRKNYRWPGTYHITINVMERKHQPLGHIVEDVSKPDGDTISVAECKTMNCIVQAICRTKDSWWKE